MTKCSFLKPESIAVKASKKSRHLLPLCFRFYVKLKNEENGTQNISFLLWVNTTKKIDFLH